MRAQPPALVQVEPQPRWQAHSSRPGTERPDPLPGTVSRVARWSLVVLVVAVLAVVFWPSRPAGGAQNGLQDWFAQQHAAGTLPAWISFALVEFTANLLMFTPLGLLATLARPLRGPLRSAALALAGCAALSASIEMVQWLGFPDRTGDLRDVLANTLGALIGAAAAVTLMRRRPS